MGQVTKAAVQETPETGNHCPFFSSGAKEQGNTLLPIILFARREKQRMRDNRHKPYFLVRES